MIPDNVKREHILQALAEIDRSGVPKGRQSRYFHLSYRGKTYPPKYVISLANKFTNGKELEPRLFSGGYESNNLLTRLRFRVARSKGTWSKSITVAARTN